MNKLVLLRRIGINILFSGLLVFLFVLLPEVGYAQNPDDVDLVRCGGEGEEMCDIEDFFDLIARVMQWGFRLGVVVSALMFAYGGFILMTSLGRPGQISKAKGIFLKSIIGLVIMFFSYTVVWFILTRLGVTTDFLQLF